MGFIEKKSLESGGFDKREMIFIDVRESLLSECAKRLGWKTFFLN